MHELDRILQHAGVKGMKWGVRKVQQKAGEVKTRVGEEVKSVKREIGWAKQLKNIHGMDRSEIKKVTDRIRNENELKKLAKGQKIRTRSDIKNKSKDVKDYRNRDKLSDLELKSKVETLRLKDNLRKEISNATKSHRELGRNFVDNVTANKSSLDTYANIGKQMIDYSYGKY